MHHLRKVNNKPKISLIGIGGLTLLAVAIDKYKLSQSKDYILNFGISWGARFQTWFLVWLVIFILASWRLGWYKLTGWRLLVTGGSLNLVDRLAFSGVVDPWRLFFLYFNLADILIVIGALLLLKSIISDIG